MGAVRFILRTYLDGYTQTWAVAARLPKLVQRVVKAVCGFLTGHEWSRTESGYCGGSKFDAWCRWCNQITQLPADAHPAKMDSKMEIKSIFDGGHQ